MTTVSLPRHVKKPGGQWLLVSTPVELEAALADGWVIRLPPPVPETRAIEGSSGAHTPAMAGSTPAPATIVPAPPPATVYAASADYAVERPAKAKRGRPRKVTTDDDARSTD